MKVLIINGSPRANGNTDIALREMEKVFAEEGVETKRLNIGTQMIHGCVACNACHRTGKCGFDDVVNRAADILRDCDGWSSARRCTTPPRTARSCRFWTGFSTLCRTISR